MRVNESTQQARRRRGYEKVARVTQKVTRAKLWKERAKTDLDRKLIGFKEELTRLDEQISQARTQLERFVDILG